MNDGNLNIKYVSNILLDSNDDEVISSLILSSKEEEVVLVTTNGKGKRLSLNNFIVQNRGGRGVSCIKLDKDDYVAAAAITKPSSSLLIVGKPNSICVPAVEFSSQSKNGMGVKIIERSKVSFMIKL